MNQETLERRLAGIPLGAVRYFDRLGSTNDEAAAWALNGAPDLALVFADEQTAGRGRARRTWITPPGAALAFSLILRPSIEEIEALTRMTALGALAVCSALQDQFGLAARIKWPNDVLLNRRKAAGVLAEAHWQGAECTAIVLGIGINVATRSVDAAVRQENALRYPATSVEEAMGEPVERLDLLHAVINRLIAWRPLIRSTAFIRAWESVLALRGEWVQLEPEEVSGKEPQGEPAPLQEGRILGLESDGGLRLRLRSGEEVSIHTGELRLRPARD